MDRDPTKTAAREAKRRKHFGSDGVCIFCPEDRLPALREWHHPAGRAYDSELAASMCRNCHAVTTESQRRAGVDLRPRRNILEREIAHRRLIAVFYRDFADSEERTADALEKVVESLDQDCPEWRKHTGICK